MTHFRNRKIWAAAALAVAVGAALWFWLSRRQPGVGELVAHLPPAEAVVLHIDVAALRRAGVLDLLAGSRAAEESDYKSFVAESGFNYREHLDRVLASFHNRQTSLLLCGRFDWKALESYAARQGGKCENGFCRMPASRPDRHISFFALRPDVMALASGPDAWGAAAMRGPTRARPAVRVSSRPVWLYVPGAAFKAAGDLPAGTRLFAKALEDADSALFSAGLSGPRMEVQIEATCRNEEGAVILRAQLEKVTDVLRKLIGRSGAEPSQKDLSGVLTQGAFRREGRLVIGRWPLERAFLESLAGGS